MNNQKIIEEFRANQGNVGGPFQTMKLLLLTSIGAKSGLKRTTPLAYTMNNDEYVVIASKGGAPTHPDWYYNLIANPDVVVEVGGDQFDAVATEVSGDERDKLYSAQAQLYPTFNDYKSNTSREIPVFKLKKK
ncbi:MAG: nitroreductase family deazaflavin-dependent oxidoreductase [Candidatus Saccharimonadia bacterium]